MTCSISPNTIVTDAVVDRFGACENPRLKQIVQAITRHVHAFVKEVELTQDEWVEAIDFLTKTGHMCDDRRQEFILLSDVFGVSMLVDAINHRMPEGTTETTVSGPFDLGEHKLTPNGATLVSADEGDPIFIEGSIKAPDGSPIVGAVIDMWHTDADGLYDAQKPELKGARRCVRNLNQMQMVASGSKRLFLQATLSLTMVL
jgi:hydroxyquinol 1,2-dioxygenase